jgi:hypothetical protein
LFTENVVLKEKFIAEDQTKERSDPFESLAKQLNLSFGTTRSILKEDLQMYSYKIHLYHQILSEDFQSRTNYCN